MGNQITDSDRLDWIQNVMLKDDNYCEVYFAGLRDFKSGQATAFQIESNPWEKFNSLQAHDIREAIDRAMEKYPCAAINTAPEPSDKVDALTLQEAKDQVAKSHGHIDWASWRREYDFFPERYHNEAAELYARSKWNQSAKEVLRAMNGYIDEGDIPIFKP